MRTLLFSFFILLIAVGLGFVIHQDPGYVMVSYNRWVITTTIWVGIAVLLLTFTVMYFFIRIIKNLIELPSTLSRRKKWRNILKSKKYFTEGLTEFYEGHFKKAEKNFLKTVKIENEKSYIYYLFAAKAANAQGAWVRRDQYLDKALLCDDKSLFAISFTKAQLLVQAQEYAEAQLILKRLNEQEPKNQLVMYELEKCYK